MRLYMGIEGMGARYCVGAVADEQGYILSAERSDLPISLHTTPRQVLRPRLVRLIRKVLSPLRLPLTDVRKMTVCVGLSGTTFPYNAERDVPRIFDELNLTP